MNFVYQLLESLSEVILAIGFVLLAKKIRVNAPKIRIKSVNATGTEKISHQKESTSEEEMLKFLIISGADVSDANSIKANSVRLGFIYTLNLPEQQNALKNKGVRIKIFNNCKNQVQRQMLSCTPISGLILAHLINGNIETADAAMSVLPQRTGIRAE